MAEKFTAKQINANIPWVKPRKRPDFSIVITEEYTPREWLRQRYRVRVMTGKAGRGKTVQTISETTNPMDNASMFMMLYGIPRDRVFLRGIE